MPQTRLLLLGCRPPLRSVERRLGWVHSRAWRCIVSTATSIEWTEIHRTNAAIRCGVRSIGGGSEPVDQRWPHVRAQRLALGIRQPQPCNQAPGLHCGSDNVWADGIEQQLRPPEQGEGARCIHGAPRQVDESASGAALNVRPLEVDAARRGDRAALQRPHRRWGVPGVQLQEFVLPVASLDADVDVAVAGEVAAGAAGLAWHVEGLDAELHAAIIAPPGPIRELGPAARRLVLLRPERRHRMVDSSIAPAPCTSHTWTPVSRDASP